MFLAEFDLQSLAILKWCVVDTVYYRCPTYANRRDCIQVDLSWMVVMLGEEHKLQLSKNCYKCPKALGFLTNIEQFDLTHVLWISVFIRCLVSIGIVKK